MLENSNETGGTPMETMKLVLPLNEEMTAIRRHIHQHPELSNKEFETTKLIR